MWGEPLHPLSDFSGAVNPCPSPLAFLPVPLFLVFVSRAGFLCSVKHQSDNLCDFISFCWPCQAGGAQNWWLSGWPPTSRADGVKRCFPALLPLGIFLLFPVRLDLSRLLWGSGPHSRDGKPGSAWLCHPSSLVMAGDTRATRSHTLYLSMNGLKLPQFGPGEFPSAVIPPQAFPWALCCCPCSDNALELLASASPSTPGMHFPAQSNVLLVLCQDPRGDWEQAAPLPTQEAL